MLVLLSVCSQTIGARLLKKMGWREGQGVGPKQQRSKESGGCVGVLKLLGSKCSKSCGKAKYNDFGLICCAVVAHLNTELQPGSGGRVVKAID